MQFCNHVDANRRARFAHHHSVDYSALVNNRKQRSTHSQPLQRYLVECQPLSDLHDLSPVKQHRVQYPRSSSWSYSTAEWVHSHHGQNHKDVARQPGEVASTKVPSAESVIHRHSVKSDPKSSHKAPLQQAGTVAPSQYKTPAPSTVADQDQLDKTVPKTGYRRARLQERQ